MKAGNKVLVLMSTYNGEKYLREQIDSVLEQIEVEVSLFVRDDGSKDGTIAILEEYKRKGALNWYQGTNLGAAKSFMDLIRRSDNSPYYAFCDQDDVWDKDKLATAVRTLKNQNLNDIPLMYCSKTQLVDEYLNNLSSEMNDKFFFTFEESLIRNSATGCTVVFNHELISYIRKYNPTYVSMHDSWIYRVCLAVDGKVVFDPTPHIKYRQHGNNVVGGRKSFYKTYKRRFLTLLGRKKWDRLLTAEQILQGYKDDMPEKHVQLLDTLINYKKSFKFKLQLITNKNMRSYNLDARICFIVSILLNRY